MGRKSNEQKKKEAISKTVAKSTKKIYQRYEIKLHKTYEAEIIKFLESKENKNRYIKELIIADMQKDKQ